MLLPIVAYLLHQPRAVCAGSSAAYARCPRPRGRELRVGSHHLVERLLQQGEPEGPQTRQGGRVRVRVGVGVDSARQTKTVPETTHPLHQFSKRSVTPLRDCLCDLRNRTKLFRTPLNISTRSFRRRLFRSFQRRPFRDWHPLLAVEQYSSFKFGALRLVCRKSQQAGGGGMPHAANTQMPRRVATCVVRGHVPS